MKEGIQKTLKRVWVGQTSSSMFIELLTRYYLTGTVSEGLLREVRGICLSTAHNLLLS